MWNQCIYLSPHACAEISFNCNLLFSVFGVLLSLDVHFGARFLCPGDSDLPGLTDIEKPRMRGPKRASKIRKLFNLSKEDDVRKYVNTYRRTFTTKSGMRSPLLSRWIRIIIFHIHVGNISVLTGSIFSSLEGFQISISCASFLSLGFSLLRNLLRRHGIINKISSRNEEVALQNVTCRTPTEGASDGPVVCRVWRSCCGF